MSNTDAASVGPVATERTAPPINEDWLAVAIGLAIFALALVSLGGADLLGWVVSAAVWSDPGVALAPASKAYAELGGAGTFIVTYLALLAVLSAGAVALGADVRRFAVAFTAVFWIGYGSWIVGNNAHLAAVTPADLQRFGINWSLKLTNEGGYVVTQAELEPSWRCDQLPASRTQFEYRGAAPHRGLRRGDCARQIGGRTPCFPAGRGPDEAASLCSRRGGHRAGAQPVRR